MNLVARRTVGVSVLSLLLTLSLVLPANAGVRQMALGVSMANSRDLSGLDNFTNHMGGQKPAIWALWSDWGAAASDTNSGSAFPTATALELAGRGVTTMINWEPTHPDPNMQNCENWSLASILSGKYDSYIRKWATAARDFGGRVIVRFAHEMNGYWYTWGDQRCTNTPKKFRKAWKRVVNIFRGPNGVGATNVRFLWSVFGPYKASYFYPGDAYVDYMGLTAFNWAQPGHPKWMSMVKTMAPTMSALRSISATKPIIAAEMGAGYNPNCAVCDKPAYITNGYPAVYTKWPQMAAMVYFNIDMRGLEQPDWRLESPTGALNAYKNVVFDSRFQGTIP
ncbi:MAG: glycosyl hydrolase [Candidatus Limnocylindrales bacterium]